MKQKYPEYEIIKDIGSGLNFGRKGLLEILEGGINGEIEEIIIAYKDRLARIGYEIIEWIIKKYSKGKIIIINKKEEETPKEEMTKDVLSILNVYVAKVNGLRKYKEKIRNDINKGQDTYNFIQILYTDNLKYRKKISSLFLFILIINFYPVEKQYRIYRF